MQYDVAVERFTSTVLPGMIRPLAKRRIMEHLAHGHRVMVVTASPDLLIQKWTKAMGVELVCNQA